MRLDDVTGYDATHLSTLMLDTCYVLAFSVIMLNTSLHNPSVKDRPDVDRFIAMNRGINDGQDLPREVLVVRGNALGTTWSSIAHTMCIAHTHRHTYRHTPLADTPASLTMDRVCTRASRKRHLRYQTAISWQRPSSTPRERAG